MMDEFTPRSDVTASEVTSCAASSDEQNTPRSDTALATTDETLEERIKRSRDRNRIHARSTRERKRTRMINTSEAIESLVKERDSLRAQLIDTSAAGILANLGTDAAVASPALPALPDPSVASDVTIKNIRKAISRDFKEKQALKEDVFAKRLAATSDPTEIEQIKREKNREHARKTRMRKKQLVETSEMNLEHEVDELKALLRQQQAPPPPPPPPANMMYYYFPPMFGLPPYAYPPGMSFTPYPPMSFNSNNYVPQQYFPGNFGGNVPILF